MLHADALFDSPDVIAVVEGEAMKWRDEVIDAIAEPDVAGTDFKVARWLDGIGPPWPAAAADIQ